MKEFCEFIFVNISTSFNCARIFTACPCGFPPIWETQAHADFSTNVSFRCCSLPLLCLFLIYFSPRSGYTNIYICIMLYI